MPTYNYTCRVCGSQFEKFVPFSENPEAQVCPNGHPDVRRLFTAPAIVFRGKGFYVNDSRPAHKESSSE